MAYTIIPLLICLVSLIYLAVKTYKRPKKDDEGEITEHGVRSYKGSKQSPPSPPPMKNTGYSAGSAPAYTQPVYNTANNYQNSNLFTDILLLETISEISQPHIEREVIIEKVESTSSYESPKTQDFSSWGNDNSSNYSNDTSSSSYSSDSSSSSSYSSDSGSSSSYDSGSSSSGDW